MRRTSRGALEDGHGGVEETRIGLQGFLLMVWTSCSPGVIRYPLGMSARFSYTRPPTGQHVLCGLNVTALTWKPPASGGRIAVRQICIGADEFGVQARCWHERASLKRSRTWRVCGCRLVHVLFESVILLTQRWVDQLYNLASVAPPWNSSLVSSTNAAYTNSHCAQRTSVTNTALQLRLTLIPLITSQSQLC